MTKGCTIEEFRGQVEKIQNAGVLRQVVLDFIDKCPISVEGKKVKTRAPSAYNLHIKECMPRLKQQGIPQEQRMKKCADEYKVKK